MYGSHMTATTNRYDAASLAATAAYEAARECHAQDYDARWPCHADGTIDLDTPRVIRCTCGWQPRAHVAPRNQTRALGLHLAAVTRQADKAWNAAYDAELERLSRPKA